ncbi:MAG: response regulator [Myxococcota bacterium]
MKSFPADALDVRVSGRCLDPIRWLIERGGLDPSALIAETRLDIDVWENPPARLSWFDFATVLERTARQVESVEELREAGRGLVHHQTLGGISKMVSTLASPARMYALAPRFGLATMAPMVEGRFERLSPTRCRIVASVPVGYTPCPAFFQISAGNFEQLPTLLGDPPAEVELETDGIRAVYTISHAPSRTLWARLHQVWNVLFGAERIFDELTERNEELSRQLSAVAAARERADQAIASQNALLAAVSHELRTPLGEVLGLIGMAREHGLTPVAQGHLRAAEGSANRLAHTVNVLMQVATLGPAVSEESAEAVCVGTWVEHVAGLFRGQRGLEVRVDAPCEHKSVVSAPPGWLDSILHELLSNAVKFTQEGHVAVQAYTTPSARDEHVDLCVKVSDTGPGIPSDWHHKVFEPFVQHDRGLGRQKQGMGLGLTLVKALVERMGGRVRLKSAVGRGTTVSIYLCVPKGAADAVNVDLASRVDRTPTPLSPASAPRVQPDADVGSPRLLVVDDNPVNRMFLSRLGERLGYRVDAVDGGESALEALANGAFDLVFMDVQMPGLDGLQTTVEVRRRQALRHLPIVAVTAQVAPGDESRCRSAGMDAYVPKPVQYDRLVAATDEALMAAAHRRAMMAS